MSTESLYQHKSGVSIPTPVRPRPAETRSAPASSIVETLGAALDSRRFKKALFVASLAAAALYYLTLLTIALVF